MPAAEFATGIPDSDAVFNWIHVEGSVNHQILTLVVISLKAGRLARKTTTCSAIVGSNHLIDAVCGSIPRTTWPLGIGAQPHAWCAGSRAIMLRLSARTSILWMNVLSVWCRLNILTAVPRAIDLQKETIGVTLGEVVYWSSVSQFERR